MSLKNILFNEAFLFEGEQKDALLAKRAAEKAAAKAADKERAERRSSHFTGSRRINKDEDIDRVIRSEDRYAKELLNRTNKSLEAVKKTRATNKAYGSFSPEADKASNDEFKAHVDMLRATQMEDEAIQAANRNERRHPKNPKKQAHKAYEDLKRNQKETENKQDEIFHHQLNYFK